MMIKERQKYDRDFKQKAVELSFARGSAKEIAEELDIRPELLYRWRREYGGLKVDQAKKLKTLEKENYRLKKLVADLSLDNAILKEAAEGNF